MSSWQQRIAPAPCVIVSRITIPYHAETHGKKDYAAHAFWAAASSWGARSKRHSIFPSSRLAYTLHVVGSASTDRHRRGSLSYRQVCLTRCAEVYHAAWVVVAVSGPPRWRSCKYWNFDKSVKSISKLIQNRRAQIYENGDSGGLGAPRGSLEAFGSQDGAQDRQEQAQKAPRGAPRGQHGAKIRLSWRQDAVMMASLAPKMANGWPPWRFSNRQHVMFNVFLHKVRTFSTLRFSSAVLPKRCHKKTENRKVGMLS